MFHFTIGIDPNLAQIGPLPLAWHGIATAVAIIVAVWVIYHQFIRRHLPVEKYDVLAFWTIVAGIIGARLFFILDHPGFFIDHPVEMLKITEGGLAIYGALIGGFFGVLIMTRILQLPFTSVIDATAPGLLLAQAIGRIGCLINGDAWGAPTSGPFSVTYTNPKALLPSDLLGVPTHPYPIYDMVVTMATFAVIWQLAKRRLPAGALFCIYAALYAVGRFFISFVRQERVWFWGLQEAQVVAIATLILAVVALFWILRRQPAPVAATAD